MEVGRKRKSKLKIRKMTTCQHPVRIPIGNGVMQCANPACMMKIKNVAQGAMTPSNKGHGKYGVYDKDLKS